MESQFPATLLSLMSGRNLSQAWGAVCGGTDFLYSENFYKKLPLHSEAMLMKCIIYRIFHMKDEHINGIYSLLCTSFCTDF
jgi:hypothetical protein